MTTSPCTITHCDRPTPTGLCRFHHTEISTRLDDAYRCLWDLHDERTRDVNHTSTDNVTTSAAAYGSVPWNEDASRLLKTVTRELLTWTARVADRLGEPVRYSNPARGIRYIQAAHSAHRLDTWDRIADFLSDLNYIRTRTDEVTDNAEARFVAGLCDNQLEVDGQTFDCGARLLADTDHGYVTCPRCHAVHSVEDRRATMRLEADDHLKTAGEAAALLRELDGYTGTHDQLVDLIRRWHDRGRLISRGHALVIGQARSLYRLGDISALIAESNHHRAARTTTPKRQRTP